MSVYHKGYKAVQMSDHKIWISKDRKIMATIICKQSMPIKKLIQAIEQYIELTEGK